MSNRIYIIAALLLILSACNQAPPLPNTLIGSDKLEADYITIDITKANTLRTANGAIIDIPENAIESDTNFVQLKVIEAYTVADMVRGGLTTKTNGIPLSSDGMIYIDVVQQNKMRRPVKVYLPSQQQREGMELFKGFVDQTGAINWNDPKPLSDTVLTTENDTTNTQSSYNHFELKEFGWYSAANSTVKMPNYTNSKLTATMQGKTDNDVLFIYLLIPSQKLFIEGGLINGKKEQYAFFTNEGNILLPQNQKAYIITMGMRDSSRVYAQTEFVTSTQQNVELILQTTPKAVIDSTLNKF